MDPPLRAPPPTPQPTRVFVQNGLYRDSAFSEGVASHDSRVSPSIAPPSQQATPPVSHSLAGNQPLPSLTSAALVGPEKIPYSREFCYRALRTEESSSKGLFAKDPASTASILEHILHGSKREFKSPYISATSELRIAISFAGPFQEIAAIRWTAWKEKTNGEVIDFANTDNRVLLLKDEENEAANARIGYARRSQEILLRKQVSAEFVTTLKKCYAITRRCELPDCIAKERFPRDNEDIATVKLLEMVGDTNDGMFRLSWRNPSNVEYKLVYKKARPNVADEIPDAIHLQRNIRREFLALSLYRRLGHMVPDYCLYEGNIMIQDGEGYERMFPFSFILFEDLPSASLPPNDDIIRQLSSSFVIDGLLGNWRLFGFSDEDRFRHIVMATNGKLARRCAESAFGLVYQDDRQKKRAIVEWHDSSVFDLDQLKKFQSWLYGHLSEEEVAQQIAALFQCKLEQVIKEIFLSSESLLCDQLLKRAFYLQQRLNWFPLPLVSKNYPVPRDGHTAVEVGSSNDRRMLIFGGSTGDKTNGTPIGDIWALNLKTFIWSCVAPSNQEFARYSHTATLWRDRYMVVIGGAVSNKKFFNDLQVFDCEKLCWLRCRNGSPNVVFPRIARHAAVLYNSNFILVYGGAPEQNFQKGKQYGKKNKKYEVLNRLYSVKLAFMENRGEVQYNWELLTPTGNQRPSGMHRHNLVTVGKKIYLISKEASKVIWRFDPHNTCWDQLAVVKPCVRFDNLSGDSMIVLGRTLISFGGAIKLAGPTLADDHPSNFGGNFANVTPVADCVVFTFELDTQTWTKPILLFGEQPKARTSASACVVDNKVIIFGGMADAGPARLNDVWVFRLGPPSQDLEELEKKTHELLSEFARRNPAMPNCEEHLRKVLEALRKAK